MRQALQQRRQELLVEVQRRLPATRQLIQEAFTTDRHRPVLEKLLAAEPDRFYLFDESVAVSFTESVLELAGRHGGGSLIVSCASEAEFPARQNRLLHLTGKIPAIRVLTVGTVWHSAALPPGMEVNDVSGTILQRCRLAIHEGPRPTVFISRALRPAGRYLGLFSFDGELASQMGDEIELVVRRQTRRLPTLEKLEMLHQTTQRVTRELESYADRVERAVQMARRRPDLLTAARCERIVSEAVRKMEQLEALPRRALRGLSGALGSKRGSE